MTTTTHRQPPVGIVVVNYRTPADSIACVRSLCSLRYPSFTIYLVENASGDGSEAEFERAFAHDPRVRLIRAKENGGYTAGNNLGIRAALDDGAEYVHVVNPDTLVLNPNYLAEAVAHLECHPCVGAVGTRVHLRTVGNVQNTVINFPWLWRRSLDWFAYRLRGASKRSLAERPIEAEVLNGVCVVFRSDCLRDVGLFDERTFAYIEDVEWAYRAHCNGWSRVFLPTESILHLQKESGYHRGGGVDFLLKRNTLYFLLKTRHWAQALGYTLATLALALPAAQREWTRRLAAAYWGLWTFSWDDVMGRPGR